MKKLVNCAKCQGKHLVDFSVSNNDRTDGIVCKKTSRYLCRKCVIVQSGMKQ